jgi:WD40 repeat protein
MVGVVLGANLYSGLSASNEGTLLASAGSDRNRVTWFGRDGKALNTVSGLDFHAGVNISPDSSRALLSVADSSGLRDFWILDFARGIRTRLPSHGNFSGFWSRDGRRVIYYVVNGGSIVERDASGVGAAQTLLSANAAQADDISPDGRILMYDQVEEDGLKVLWLLPLSTPGEVDGKPNLYLKTRARGGSTLAQFSPDGKWVAYGSDEAGQTEIYVQSFPNPEKRVQVSSSGGSFPRWRRDGKELFYRATDGRLSVAAVRETGAEIEFSTPTPLFRIPEFFGGRYYPYDVSADGQKILALMPDNSENAPLTVLINWQAAFKK